MKLQTVVLMLFIGIVYSRYVGDDRINSNELAEKREDKDERLIEAIRKRYQALNKTSMPDEVLEDFPELKPFVTYNEEEERQKLNNMLLTLCDQNKPDRTVLKAFAEAIGEKSVGPNMYTVFFTCYLRNKWVVEKIVKQQKQRLALTQDLLRHLNVNGGDLHFFKI